VGLAKSDAPRRSLIGMSAAQLQPQAVELCCYLIQLIRGRSFPEAAMSAALVVGQRDELRPGHARPGQGAEYFQYVGRLAGKLGGGVACLLSLFHELGQPRLAIADFI
jgi:hypothetical protein